MKTFKEYLKENHDTRKVNERSLPSIEDTYNKIKDWDIRAIRGFARSVGVSDESLDTHRRDREGLMDEIFYHLYGDDNWVGTLMDKGVRV